MQCIVLLKAVEEMMHHIMLVLCSQHRVIGIEEKRVKCNVMKVLYRSSRLSDLISLPVQVKEEMTT